MKDLIILSIIYYILGIPLSIFLNKKYNLNNYMGYKYGYYLSIITIYNGIVWLIILYNTIFNQNFYKINTSDIFGFVILVLIICIFHISISILNGKKYK